MLHLQILPVDDPINNGRYETDRAKRCDQNADQKLCAVSSEQMRQNRKPRAHIDLIDDTGIVFVAHAKGLAGILRVEGGHHVAFGRTVAKEFIVIDFKLRAQFIVIIDIHIHAAKAEDIDVFVKVFGDLRLQNDLTGRFAGDREGNAAAVFLHFHPGIARKRDTDVSVARGIGRQHEFADEDIAEHQNDHDGQNVFKCDHTFLHVSILIRNAGRDFTSCMIGRF